MKKTLLAACCLLATAGQAKVTLPRLFGDGMVMQQESTVPVWGTTDKAGATVRVTTSWNLRTYTTRADAEGRFRLCVQTPAYGGPYELTVTDGAALTLHDVLVGEVWLCSGQSNMDMRVSGRYGDGVFGALDAVMTSTNPGIRVFSAAVKFAGTPQTDVDGSWQQAGPETTGDFPATAYFFARRLNEVLRVPVGIVHASCGGSKVEAWMSDESVAPFTHLKEVENPACLWNGMMSAIVGYGIRGCLWYQGEANVDSPDLYTTLLPTMVADWRRRWEQDFPFYYAQIAPYNYNHKEGKGRNSAFLREAQVRCLDSIPNSGMICLSDIGQPHTIHPMEKQTVGNRFACLALSRTYGMAALPASGPVYRGIAIDGNRVEVFFDSVGKGLTTYRQPFADFEIAGSDRVFHPASVAYGKDARSLVLSSADVPRPVAVRYGFKDYFKGCLYNMMGLPASSFRSDNWEEDGKEEARVNREEFTLPSSLPDDSATLTVYHPQKPCGKAIVMCPGGGYDHLALTHEGHDMAPWMNAMGITYCVLRYRMPHQRHEVPLSDAEAAMRLVRRHAQAWGVDPTQVGIMGASAGGHLAASLATLAAADARPNFQILLYPVISMDERITNRGTHDNLIGRHPSKKLLRRFTLWRQVDKRTPRAFIALSADDKVVVPENTRLYAEAMRQKGLPCGVHIYPSGGHGWGFKDSFEFKREWTSALEEWLRSL